MCVPFVAVPLAPPVPLVPLLHPPRLRTTRSPAKMPTGVAHAKRHPSRMWRKRDKAHRTKVAPRAKPARPVSGERVRGCEGGAVRRTSGAKREGWARRAERVRAKHIRHTWDKDIA